ncbi:hypothetical protein, partial [Peribacillus simplex]|uniref:hypothetical protein n=1 Tax=Peribacillus simplex TaxID=1478 RepID=UPI003D29967A
RRLTARTKESEHLEGKSTTTHYLVNSNKVCKNSLIKRTKACCYNSLISKKDFTIIEVVALK